MSDDLTPLMKVKFTTTGDQEFYLNESELLLLKGDPHLVLIEGEDYRGILGRVAHVGPPLRDGYRVVPGFPDYMVNVKANVRHIPTGRSCWLEEVTKKGQAMVVVKRNGVNHYKSAQKLRDSAFPKEKNMAQKAKLITNENKSDMEKLYNEDTSTGVELAVGYYLVAGFGDHLGYELLNSANFNRLYSKGGELKNGFFEAIKRSPSTSPWVS